MSDHSSRAVHFSMTPVSVHGRARYRTREHRLDSLVQSALSPSSIIEYTHDVKHRGGSGGGHRKHRRRSGTVDKMLWAPGPVRVRRRSESSRESGKDSEGGFRRKLGSKIVALGKLIAGQPVDNEGIVIVPRTLSRSGRSKESRSGRESRHGKEDDEERHHRRRKKHRRHTITEREADSPDAEDSLAPVAIRSTRVPHSGKDRSITIGLRSVSPASEVEARVGDSDSDSDVRRFRRAEDRAAKSEAVRRRDAEERQRLEKDKLRQEKERLRRKELRRKEEERIAREKQQEEDSRREAHERAFQLRKAEEEKKQEEIERQRQLKAARLEEIRDREKERDRLLKEKEREEIRKNERARQAQAKSPRAITYKHKADDSDDSEGLAEDRCIGDMQRTHIEGLVPVTKKSRKAGKYAKSIARHVTKDRRIESDESEGLADDRCIGDMQRTHIEGLVPATKKKARDTGKRTKLTAPKLSKRRVENSSDEDDIEGLDDDRCIGDMQRTHIEGLVPKTEEEKKTGLKWW